VSLDASGTTSQAICTCLSVCTMTLAEASRGCDSCWCCLYLGGVWDEQQSSSHYSVADCSASLPVVSYRFNEVSFYYSTSRCSICIRRCQTRNPTHVCSKQTASRWLQMTNPLKLQV